MRAQQREVSEGPSTRRDYRFRKVAVNVVFKGRAQGNTKALIEKNKALSA